MNIIEVSDWYGTVTLENREWYIVSLIALLSLQAYIFWRTRD